MKSRKIYTLLLAYLFANFCLFSLPNDSYAARMILKSKDFRNGQFLRNEYVYEGFGCQGGNKMPDLEIKNLPAKAKSIAITIYDTDAPTGSGWWHYLAYDIPVNITKIEDNGSNIANIASFGRNDYGDYGYGGPCPPKGHGKHKYIFTVYALKVEKLGLANDPSAALISYNLNANAIEKASLTAIYKRK